MVRRRSSSRLVASAFAALVIHGQLALTLWVWERLHPRQESNDVIVEYVPASEAEINKQDLPPDRVTLPPPPDQQARKPQPPKKEEPFKFQPPSSEEKQAVEVPPPAQQPTPAPQPAP